METRPFYSDAALDWALADPPQHTVETLAGISGDLAVLGAGGKMGLTVALMARRAIADADRRVIGVSRFRDDTARTRLADYGIETVACDLSDPRQVAALPPVENVIFMAGRKFGTTGDEPGTWAANTIVPVHVAERFAASRIVVYSTGCVYPFVEPASGGSRETDAPAPVGEYAQSALGRERIFEYFSRTEGTRVCIFRLNYAVDLRYGVLHDVARRIAERRPVDVSMGYVNVIWQGDAAAYSLSALGLCDSPATHLNATGPETISVRRICTDMAERLGVSAAIEGSEAATAYLSDASQAFAAFGYPRVPAARLIAWTTEWIDSGGGSLNKPTHFEESGGAF